MGTKWSKLHAGPMWSGQQVPQGVAPKTTHKIEEVHNYCDLQVSCLGGLTWGMAPV